jgi:histamine-gated chloride channel
MPENPKSYDKMRPPKKEGQATTVFFHVTVMGLDSIDETSMVRLNFNFHPFHHFN